MKKMRNGRRGFTLLEIVIVVAIIVILSAGAFLGVAATVNNASDMQERLEANNGDHFEEYARNQVESYGKNMVYWDPIPNYTPENQAKKMKEQMLNEGWTDGEITFDYQEDGWHIIAEWDPSIPEHRGFQTPEDYKLWLSNYNAYIKLGYTAEEIEAGCKNGSTDIKPVWDASKHGGVSEEEYLKQKQGGGAQNPVTPNDPVWNGHPESWWDEHDAEIEKKIQEAISKGVNPDDIKVTRNPETGHITDYVIPSAPNGSGTGTGNQGDGNQGGGTVVEGEGDKDKDKNTDTDYSSYPANFVTSRPNTNGTVKTAGTVGANAPGASTSNNGNNIQASFGGNVDSFVYHLPDGAVFDNYNGGTITSLGGGYYRWTSDGNSYPSNMAIHTPNYGNFSDEQANGFFISEVIIHQY